MLLIDDTWTTGASAQSAAAALKAAGAGATASIVIGRHLNREWHENDRRIRGIARPFDWSRCALCAERKSGPRRRNADPADVGARSATADRPAVAIHPRPPSSPALTNCR